VNVRLLSIVLLGSSIAIASACSPTEDLCSYLDAALVRCDLPAPNLACTDAEEGTKALLVARIKERGCDGLKEADGDAVDPRLCAFAGWSCPAPPTPEPAGAVPAQPIVLVGGIDSSAVFDWHPRIAAALREHGATVQHVQVVPWSTTPERAADLWRSLAGLHSRLGQKLNLVCYAVGGIDCRFVASPKGLFAGDTKKLAEVNDTIASITTIATPHRGTRVAEAARSLLQSGTTDDLLASLVGADVEVPDDAALLATLAGLTPEAMAKFNREVPDAGGIVYQSWAGTSHVLARTSNATERALLENCADEEGKSLLFRHEGAVDAANPILFVTFPFSGTSLGDDGRVVSSPSDGMVSVASAKWGTFRGCLPADHYDVIGQIGHTTRDPLTGFDAPRFYRWLAADLAAKGL
jgi:triacylglycerol lipase